MQMEYDVLVGFSVNPEEHWWSTNGTPEPGNKNPARHSTELSGTSYDVAVALQRAGRRPFLVGVVGRSDHYASYVDQQLEAAQIPHLALRLRPRTPVASIIHGVLPNGHDLHLSDKEPLQEVPAVSIAMQLRSIAPRIRVVTGLMLDPKELALTRLLLDGDQCLRVLNPPPALVRAHDELIQLLGVTDWLVLNRYEAAAFFPDGETVDPAVFLRYGPKLVLVTKDRAGATLYGAGGVCHEIPAFAAGSEVHATGAGDCFLGYFLAGHLMGWPLDRCLALAAVAAGIKVTVPGTASSPLMVDVIPRLEAWEHYRELGAVTSDRSEVAP